MGTLTKGDVRHIAELSNLTLTEAEIDKFLPQLSKILEFVSQLSEVDTSGIKPTTQTTGLVNVLRDDEVVLDDQLKIDGYFKVPSILHGRTDK